MPIVIVTPENASQYPGVPVGMLYNTTTGQTARPSATNTDRASRNAEVQRRASLLTDPSLRPSEQELWAAGVPSTSPATQGPPTSTNPLPGPGTYRPPGSTPTTPPPPPSTDGGFGDFYSGNFTTHTNPKIDPLTKGPIYNREGGTGTLPTSPMLPAGSPPTTFSAPMSGGSTSAFQSATLPTNDTNGGLIALGGQASTPGIQASKTEFAPGREGVVNAMTKRFDARKWF